MPTATLDAVTSDETLIRQMADRWARALERKDVAGLTADYSDDVLLFDCKPPYQVCGVENVRAMWAACLPCFPDRFKSVRHDLQVTVAGDVAYTHSLHRVESDDLPPNPAAHTYLRVTTCCRRVDGKWKVTHEHVSLPFDPMSGQATWITEADLL